jgi:hypothetical protein
VIVMLGNGLKHLRKYAAWTFAVLMAGAGVGRADDATKADLKATLEAQKRQIEELKQMLQSEIRPAADSKADPAPAAMDEAAVKKIVEGYLKDNPGAGMPPSVQTGFVPGSGFVIRSAADPKYVKWDDDCKIPFDLNIKGQMQLNYTGYKVTDNRNHLTGNLANPVTVFNPVTGAAVGRVGANTTGDFSELDVKRAQLIFAGTVFDPDFHFFILLDGNTRGITGLTSGNGINQGGNGLANAGNGNTVLDHAVRLFNGYVFYDFHGCASQKGCGADCGDCGVLYSPTYTLMAGKIKPFLGYEEFFKSFNQQLVEYSMADWFFDADDDNQMMGAGGQIRAFEDRLFMQGFLTNGNETQIANLQMDNLPGFNLGGWYDFGGTWNPDKKKWDLAGIGLADLAWSYNPVVRVGGAMNLVPMGRRSIYTNAELNRVRLVPAAPGGSTILSVMSGGPAVGGVANLANSLDAVDEYTFDAFVNGKFRGFSLTNEWWARDLTNFRGQKNTAGLNNPILYSANSPGGAGVAALFPANHGLFDYGMMLQGGYFVVPKKLELVGRWSWIRGQSGNINGNGTFTTIRSLSGVPTAVGPIRVVNGAFNNFSEVNEYAVGVNYYFKGQALKWQTDLGFYNGGNPAGASSAPGFISGVDGYMLRTQLQFQY